MSESQDFRRLVGVCPTRIVQYREASHSFAGNLEIVARSKNVLFHFWRANNTEIADVGGRRMWYGPWVVSY